MLPTRLEIRNFLAYRAPEPIALAGIDLACLSGPNGVGKSSLLDAITWALWGKARSRRDDELIHLGQSEMSVSLDFEQDKLRYRVTRRRSRAGRGSRGSLDLLVWGDNDRPRLINADGMRRTQDKINAILRLDYDTFTHSAFLQQSQADAFTLKTPAERKRLLADILGLDEWAQYEEAAKARLSQLGAQSDIISHDIRRLDEEIAGEPELQAERQSLSQGLAEAQAELEAASQRFDLVANSAAVRQREQANAGEKERQIRGLRADIDAAQAEVERLAEQLEAYQRALAAGDKIEAGYQQLQAARESQSLIAEHLAQRQAINQRIHELEQALAEQRAGMRQEAQAIRQRVTALEERIAAADSSQLDQLRQQVHELQQLDEQRNAAARDLQKLQVQRTQSATRRGSLISEGRALNERIERLEAADGAACPLCGQPLTRQHRDDMLAQLTGERDAMRDEYRQVSAGLRQNDSEQQTRQKELEGWAQELKHLPAMQQRLGAAVELSRHAEEAETQLQLEATGLAQLEARLHSQEFGAELRRQLAELQEQRARLSVDAADQAQAQSQLDDLAAYDRQHTELEIAKRSLPEAQTRHAETAARLSKLQGTLRDEEGRLKRIQQDIADLASKVEQERELRAEVERIRSRVQTQRERIAIREQQLHAIGAGRASKKRLEQRLSACRDEASLYKDLRQAFGRNGLPAMIIEAAVPELEAEANDLLARLSDGRMKLNIRTQRERASGAIAETLELEIADELGARPYELYSGGEAFRINFAIRIALSKLLARRAGAQLRALFIDEGFGSQDEAGRDKLVEAINIIKADFELILVITHIDELREAFPRRLMVEKTAAGSIVKLG